MTSEDAQVFLSRLAVGFRELYASEREGWLEWLLTGFAELELATEALETLYQQSRLPRLPAFKALYAEFHRVRQQRAARGKRYPKCDLCHGRGTIHYVRGGFSSRVTRPMRHDHPRNFPYLTDLQFTFCRCDKGRDMFLEVRPEADWQKQIDFVLQIGLGGDLNSTGRFIDACRKLPPESWEAWQGTLGRFEDLPLAESTGAEEELLDIPI